MCSLESLEFNQGLQMIWTVTNLKEKHEACDAFLRGTCLSIAQVFALKLLRHFASEWLVVNFELLGAMLPFSLEL